MSTEVRKEANRDCLILGVINQKGGVGKSTTAVNLSAALGEQGFKVLLVDLDPQGNSSSGIGFDKTDCELSSYDCLLNDDAETQSIIEEVNIRGVDLIPATIDLAGAEAELVQEISRESRLKEALEEVEAEYDFIIIDCPPSLGLLTINALTAANQLIIPIQCEFFALEGLAKIMDSVNMVKKRLNKKLEIFGVVITMFDGRTSLAKQVAEEVQNYFGEKVFSTKIPRTVRISEAPGYGLPITEYEPNGKGAKAYRDLAEETIERYYAL
ncbi:MAG: ParA family protein [Coriobacteriales bacterium]